MKCEWREVKLQDIALELSDGLHKAPVFYPDGEYIFVNATNIENGRIVEKDPSKKTSLEEFLKYGVELTNRTILYSIDGTIGNIAKYRGEKCLLGKGACYITLNDSVDVDYIYYLLQSPIFNEYIHIMSTGSTIRHISLKTMRSFTFQLPPIMQQKTVGRVLSLLDDKIELNNKINENLERQAQAFYQELFINNADVEWPQGTISDLGIVVGGSTPSKSKPEYYTENGIAWITPKDLSTNKSKFISHGKNDITELGLKSSSATIMPKGTVLFSSRAPIGYIAIAAGEAATNQGFKSVIPKPEIGTAFVYYFLKHNLPVIEGMASGSTFKEISGSTMKNVPAVIPDIDTLKQFNNFCVPIFAQQQFLEKQNSSLTKLRDTILPKLMSSDITVG